MNTLALSILAQDTSNSGTIWTIFFIFLLIVFLVANRRIVEGVRVSALKG